MLTLTSACLAGCVSDKILDAPFKALGNIVGGKAGEAIALNRAPPKTTVKPKPPRGGSFCDVAEAKGWPGWAKELAKADVASIPRPMKRPTLGLLEHGEKPPPSGCGWKP